MHSEKEIRLRIDLLESQSSAIARMLAKAMRERNDSAFSQYSARLAENRGKVEELLWVLGEKASQSVLDLQVSGSGFGTVRQTLDRLKQGELRMDDLAPEAQALLRKGALELRYQKDAEP